MVIEHGITIGGKPFKDHLEAVDHFEALRFVRNLARQAVPLRETDIRNLHRLVMQRSDPDMAGRYANQGRYVETDSGRHHFPSPAEVPPRMGDFAKWLGAASTTPETAFTAHRRLVEIHPFNDGNGRTARLLMNLVLLRGGYPPVAVRLQDRPAYIDALQHAQTGRGSEAFEKLLYERLDATLGECLSALQGALTAPTEPDPPSGKKI
jgi:Fic family protein